MKRGEKSQALIRMTVEHSTQIASTVVNRVVQVKKSRSVWKHVRGPEQLREK